MLPLRSDISVGATGNAHDGREIIPVATAFHLLARCRDPCIVFMHGKFSIHEKTKKNDPNPLTSDSASLFHNSHKELEGKNQCLN